MKIEITENKVFMAGKEGEKDQPVAKGAILTVDKFPGHLVGKARIIEDERAKYAALKAFTEHILPQRWAALIATTAPWRTCSAPGSGKRGSSDLKRGGTTAPFFR